MGAEFWKFKRPKKIEGRDKPFLVDMAFTVMHGVSENGKPYMKLTDDRTGQEAWGFIQEPRQQGTSYPQAAAAPAPAYMPGQAPSGPPAAPPGDPEPPQYPAGGEPGPGEPDAPW